MTLTCTIWESQIGQKNNNEVNQTTKQDFKNWVGKFLDKRDLNIGHL
jgi:hypothetical protein